MKTCNGHGSPDGLNVHGRQSTLIPGCRTVTSKSSTQLRLHVEQHPDEQIPAALPQLNKLCHAFQQATGWELRHELSPGCMGEVWSTAIDGCGQSSGRLVLASPIHDQKKNGPAAPAQLSQVRPLALTIGGLLGEINQLKHAIWQREAELAAGVPISATRDGEPHLADRLEAILKGGAEAIGCQAAGLYLLDEATTELKLRASWGLPDERLMAPARPLRGAIADLEALVGHAVVLDDTSLLPHWRCPESFPAAVCVPISSPSTQLGTLWVFSSQQRDFTPEQTNLLEIIAGRLAAELEREMLLATGSKAKERGKQIDIAARWLSDRLPSIKPLIDDYEFAGWTRQAAEVGGDFHDWSVLPDGRISLAVGHAEGAPLEGALGAATLHASLKSHAAYPHDAAGLMTRVNDSLVAASPGDQRASLTYATIEPESGNIELAMAGENVTLLIDPESRLITTTDSPRLGEAPDLAYTQEQLKLRPGEALVLISSGVKSAVDVAGLRIGEAAIASLIANHLRDSAADLLVHVRKLLEQTEISSDMTLLVVKRR
jgi:serine phosphatase RsbU (regulator of sigma subunit)